MNCTCITEIGQKLTEQMAKDGAVNPKVYPNFVGIDFNGGRTVVSLPYTVHGDNRPYSSQKGKTISMVASFCPFCGKSTKAEPAAQPAAEAA
jgi:hypothetical protein